MPTICVWTAPAQASITAVAAGQTVSVRIRPKAGSAALVPDAAGVPAHLMYLPTIAPDGTGALQQWDTLSGLYGPQVGDRPSELSSGQITGEKINFLVDLGKPFFCPWSGQLFIEGGLVAGADTADYEVSIVSTTPQLIGIRRDRMLRNNEPCQYDVVHETGAVPHTAPTITYLGVPEVTPGIQLPRGVWAVQVSELTDIVFTPFGGATTTMRVYPGAPCPVGPLSQGTFAATPGNTIKVVSFHVEIA